MQCSVVVHDCVESEWDLIETIWEVVKKVFSPPTPNEFKEGNETNNNLNDIRNVFYYHQEDK